MNANLHDLEHLFGSGGDAVGEEGDQEGHVVHRLQVRPNVLDPSGKLSPVRHVIVQLVGVACHAGRGLNEPFMGLDNYVQHNKSATKLKMLAWTGRGCATPALVIAPDAPFTTSSYLRLARSSSAARAKPGS